MGTERGRSHSGGRARAANVGWYLLLTALAVVVLFPVYMTLIRAVSGGTATLFQERPPLTPVTRNDDTFVGSFLHAEWGSFWRAFKTGELARPMAQSLVVTVIITAFQTVTAIGAGYAFAFLRFPFKRVVFAVVLATLLLPIEVTLIANVQSMYDVGLIDNDQSWAQSIGALTLPFLSTALGIFLVRQGFLGIPRDLRDASRLDGYSELSFMWRVAVPVTKPIIGSFVVISFLGAYNQYVWPRYSVKRQTLNTVQTALPQFQVDNPTQLNWGFAAALVASIPVLVLLIFFQRQLVRGLTAGAVK